MQGIYFDLMNKKRREWSYAKGMQDNISTFFILYPEIFYPDAEGGNSDEDYDYLNPVIVHYLFPDFKGSINLKRKENSVYYTSFLLKVFSKILRGLVS